ncbi:tRNA pseudouridine synthase B [Spiroplasma helicoides]|uniref:tRNA pseudouridine synthase B n=1 Tax=Spiroplasma helicoides TaxID=216938 RepID=A0A1B3SK47_9MOLU|nr:tRNA pseudouridine(55) synthase TruB [Spiroplasma helicoides]AOG60303.1 tRNA pseudouridine synthase B [Spiroplasma helicoides]
MKKSGIFLVNKPQDITSNDLIQKIKTKFNIKKIGHAGTLDPLATGLMVVLVNQATKVSNYLLNADKTYKVEMQLFVRTDSGDISGNEIEIEEFRKISKKEVLEVAKKYNGYMYDQYPPIYSAIKVNGKKLYEYARKNQDVEITPKTVTISSCEILDINTKQGTISFIMSCSKGTYVRSFVNDFAKDLGTIATVSKLERTKSGEFDLTQAKNIEDLEEKDLLSMYDALMQNKQTLIEYHKIKDIMQGKTITVIGRSEPIIFLVDDKKNVTAVYRWVAKELYACQRGLWDEDWAEGLSEAEREL